MAGQTKRYWGTQHIARMCQVTPATVANWIDQGHLPGHRTPTGRRRVEADALVEFLRAHDMPVPPELREEREAVVVVEDDPNYLRALVRFLERSNLDVEVVATTTGMDGLLEIGRRHPSVVVLDYGLPDLNADALVERLQNVGGAFDAEVIVVSGGLPAGAEQRLRQAGVPAVLDKSVGMDAVVNAVRDALGREPAAR
jgi:CheY-like chemotaxis protein